MKGFFRLAIAPKAEFELAHPSPGETEARGMFDGCPRRGERPGQIVNGLKVVGFPDELAGIGGRERPTHAGC